MELLLLFWNRMAKNTNNKHIMKAVSGYDNIRHNVMENHDRVVNDINKVKNNLRQKNLNFEIA